MDNPDLRERLIEALSSGDESTRADRADRILWISEHDTRPPAFAGPMDTCRVLQEAHDCFIHGYFVACMMLATSFMEHTLSDELNERGLIKGKPTLERIIEMARDKLDLPHGLLERADDLRVLRNPFVHRRPAEDQSTFGNRFKAARTHPENVLETDAKLAIMVMYQLFGLTLKRA